MKSLHVDRTGSSEVWLVLTENHKHVATTTTLEMARMLQIALKLRTVWSDWIDCCDGVKVVSFPELEALLKELADLDLRDPQPAPDSPNESRPEAPCYVAQCSCGSLLWAVTCDDLYIAVREHIKGSARQHWNHCFHSVSSGTESPTLKRSINAMAKRLLKETQDDQIGSG